TRHRANPLRTLGLLNGEVRSVTAALAAVCPMRTRARASTILRVVMRGLLVRVLGPQGVRFGVPELETMAPLYRGGRWRSVCGSVKKAFAGGVRGVAVITQTPPPR